MAAPAQQSPASSIRAGEPISFPALGNQARDAKRKPSLESLLTASEVAADLLCVLVSVALAYVIFPPSGSAPMRMVEVAAVASSIAGVTLMIFERGGMYAPGSSLLRVRETERVLRGWCQTLFLCSPIATFVHGASRSALLFVVFAIPFLLILEKNIVYFGIHKLHAHGYAVRNAVIYGAGMTGRRVFSALARSPKLGVRPVAFVDDDPARSDYTVHETSYKRRQSVPIVAGPVTPDLLRSVGAKMLIIGIPTIGQEKLGAAGAAAAAAGCMLCVAPYDFAPGPFSVQRADVDGTLLVMFQSGITTNEPLKRLVDVVLSTVLLALFLPLFVMMSAVIRMTSRGPALFAQERVGKDGKLFRMYKFRTMYVDAPAYDYSPESVRDPRITTVGCFLRRSSLDELPQLINVLKGDMSLVGPRPEMPFIVEQYNETHRQRLRVKPGITGLWQLSADRAYRIHENLEYDLYYIRHRTFFMDVAILLHTLVFAARGI
jgi:exopolysaccharide biosynthesis polyprenyl glycosylphosphotransferase